MPTDTEQTGNVRLDERQSIEELTGGQIRKIPREEWEASQGGAQERAGEQPSERGEPSERAERTERSERSERSEERAPGIPRELSGVIEQRGESRPDKDEVEAWKAGYRPGMDAREAREKGIDKRTFISQEIEHHIEDKGYDQERAIAAAYSEARRGGYDVKSPEEVDED